MDLTVESLYRMKRGFVKEINAFDYRVLEPVTVGWEMENGDVQTTFNQWT